MASVEAEASRDERSSAGGLIYDGFISYSHAADDLLAPRLQAGLQRFAKPWWKRRALRIFRDESSLSANPHLWSSITDALDQSGWFVLLLSPDAAESPWVSNEVEYWLEHKDADRIIPVLTDGEFGWANGDVTGDAFPAALVGAFSDEPRWVDLRFARTEEQLDLKNPTFSAAIADIASPIRGVPKDELESEEVRQHRRTTRTAWAAGFALLALVVLAGATAVYAIGQRNDAQDQQELAEASAQAEAEARQEADSAAEAESEARGLADLKAAEAEQNALVAKSRELAAASLSVIGADPELSTLLAMESIHALPPEANVSPVGVLALREAMTANPLISRVDGDVWAVISQDGSTAYYSSLQDRSVVAVDLVTGTELWRYHDPSTIDNFEHISLSESRGLVSVSILDRNNLEDETVAVDEDGSDDHPARVVVLDVNDGEVVEVITPGECSESSTYPRGFSPDGNWLSVRTGAVDCSTDPSADWVSVFDTTTWEEQHRFQIDDVLLENVSFSADSSRILLHGLLTAGDGGATELRSFPDLELINTLPTALWATLSPDGQRVVMRSEELGGIEEVDLRPILLDADTGELIARLNEVDDFLRGSGLVYSADGSRIGVVTRAKNLVFRADNGRLVADLGEAAAAVTLSFTKDGTTTLSGTDTSLLVFDVSGGAGASGHPIQLPDDRNGWFNPNTGVGGPNLAATALAWRGLEELTDVVTVVLDPITGSTVASMPGWAAQLLDGRFVVAQWSLGEEDHIFGPVVVWDPTTGSTEVVDDCVARESQLVPGGELDCEGPAFAAELVGFTNNLAATVLPVVASGDGSYFVAQAYAFGAERAIRVWDSQTLEVRSEFEIPKELAAVATGPNRLVAGDGVTGDLFVYDIDSGAVVRELLAGPIPYNLNTILFAPDGSVLFAADFTGRMFAFDTTTWEPIVDWETHDAFVRGVAISADGTRLVTTGEDNFVKVWNIGSLTGADRDNSPPLLLDRIPAPRPSDAAWLDGTATLAVFPARDASLMIVPLSVDSLLADAEERLTRGFSPGECSTYQIDPCPTLEDIRSR